MEDEEPKLKLVPKVKIHFSDGDQRTFQNVDIQINPIGIFAVENDKPFITKIFPWSSIKELEIPVRIKRTKIVGVEGQPFGGR